MKVYDILTLFSYAQKHCVVAENMAEAEKLFLKAYPDCTIIEIKVHSDYVELPNQKPKEIFPKTKNLPIPEELLTVKLPEKFKQNADCNIAILVEKINQLIDYLKQKRV